jgi:hypothetical protein
MNSVPYQAVQLCGLIVGIIFLIGLQIKSNRTLIELNDGTGTIQCINWGEPLSVALGDIITIRGRLQIYTEIQINTTFIEQGSIETELLHSMQVIRLQKMYKKNTPIDIPKKINKVKANQNSIKTILAKYLTNLTREFKFKEIISDIDFISELQHHTSSNIEIAVGKHLQSLVRDGFIYQKDIEQDTYELITVDNLGKELVEIVKNEGFVSNGI